MGCRVSESEDKMASIKFDFNAFLLSLFTLLLPYKSQNFDH